MSNENEISLEDAVAAARAGIYPRWWSVFDEDFTSNHTIVDSFHNLTRRLDAIGTLLMICNDGELMPPYVEIGSELSDLAIEAKLLTDLWWEGYRQSKS